MLCRYGKIYLLELNYLSVLYIGIAEGVDSIETGTVVGGVIGSIVIIIALAVIAYVILVLACVCIAQMRRTAGESWQFFNNYIMLWGLYIVDFIHIYYIILYLLYL